MFILGDMVFISTAFADQKAAMRGVVLLYRLQSGLRPCSHCLPCLFLSCLTVNDR